MALRAHNPHRGGKPSINLPTQGIPVVRTYAREDDEGNLVHTAVHRHPRSGSCVQVTRRLSQQAGR